MATDARQRRRKLTLRQQRDLGQRLMHMPIVELSGVLGTMGLRLRVEMWPVEMTQHEAVNVKRSKRPRHGD
jgi:hypothetical protein